MENKTEKNKADPFDLSIQEAISIGYLILIIVGMFLEYVEYRSFGINIIEYSDFADFLIAPFKNPILIGVPILFGFLFLTNEYFTKKRKLKKEEKSTKGLKFMNYKGFTIITILSFICMNLGFGLSGFNSNHNRIESRLKDNIKNTTIQFLDGTTKDVYLLGKNTSNLFYFENDNIDLIVSPINGNIKNIKPIPKKKRKKKK